jgi:hypothetical protein
MSPISSRGRSNGCSSFVSRVLAVAGALTVLAIVPGAARAATGEAKKAVTTAPSNCVDEIWEIRAVPADKVGKTESGAQVVVIEPSEKSDDVVGSMCPKPERRTVIQIVPTA